MVIASIKKERIRKRYKHRYAKRRDYFIEYQRNYYLKNSDIVKAGRMVNNALKKGELVKQKCEICSHDKTVAHHDDYNKPLDIRWLCQSCHRLWHANNKPIRIPHPHHTL